MSGVLHPLETRHLRLVATILEEGTLTKAAIRLRLSQSALSCQLKDLETRLGGVLFERQGRRLAATPAALRLQTAAARVIPEIESAEKDIAHLVHDGRTRARIATQCYTCYHWLTPVIADLQNRFPKLQLEIAAEETHQVLTALFEGRLDLAVVPERPKDRRLMFWPLTDDELALLVPAGHPLASRRVVQARDFSSMHLITFDLPPRDLDIFRKVLYPARVSPERVTRVQLTEAILEMVLARVGFTVMARWMARPYLDAGKLTAIRIAGPGLKRRWQLAALRTASPQVLEFAQAVSLSVNRTTPRGLNS